MLESDASEPEPPASSEEAKESTLLFGVQDVSEIEYADPNMGRYIKATPIAHTIGRHASRQFQKSEINIAEQLIDHLMQTEDSTGYKQKTSKIVKDALGIVNERTEKNPVQVPIRTVENAGPRGETVRLKYDGISVPQAVDVAPQRRVDEALKFIVQGMLNDSYKTTTTAAKALTQQLIGATDYDIQTCAISRKEEKEHVAETAR